MSYHCLADSETFKSFDLLCYRSFNVLDVPRFTSRNVKLIYKNKVAEIGV